MVGGPGLGQSGTGSRGGLGEKGGLGQPGTRGSGGPGGGTPGRRPRRASLPEIKVCDRQID